MKYKVIGWTHYDDTAFEAAPCSEAACQAIIDDIRVHGYLFTGYAHQEFPRCVPVLNDGKKRLFTQRNWGDVMAKARKEYSPMAYALYSFAFRKDEKEKLPAAEREVSPSAVKIEDLKETFLLSTSEELLREAEQGELFLPLTDPLRFLDRGDALTLQAGEKRFTYAVEGVNWGWEKQEGGYISLFDLLTRFDFAPSKEEREQAAWLYEHGKRMIAVKIKRK